MYCRKFCVVKSIIHPDCLYRFIIRYHIVPLALSLYEFIITAFYARLFSFYSHLGLQIYFLLSQKSHYNALCLSDLWYLLVIASIFTNMYGLDFTPPTTMSTSFQRLANAVSSFCVCMRAWSLRNFLCWDRWWRRKKNQISNRYFVRFGSFVFSLLSPILFYFHPIRIILILPFLPIIIVHTIELKTISILNAILLIYVKLSTIEQ